MSRYVFLLAFLMIGYKTIANNVQLSNILVSNNNLGTGKVVQFDLSWENSLRSSITNNYDGVWVFFKVKDNNGKWYHLNFTGDDITMPVGAAYNMGGNSGNPGIGMFIYRAQNGFGNVNVTSIKAGITSYAGTFEIRGYAIEMVYIPQGAFFVGDGASFNGFQNSNSGNNPFEVLGPGSAVTCGTGTGNLYDPLSPGFSGNLGNYPTGYDPFWVMKYELSVGAYRDFLNTLTKNQQITRFSVDPTSAIGTPILVNNSSSYDIYLKIITPAGTITPAEVGCKTSVTDTYEWKPMTYLRWTDVAAYLDWAGLRPISEMEYEKACRGPLTSVANEYAWGDAAINDWTVSVNGNPESVVVIGNRGAVNETISNASGIVGNGTYGSVPFTGGMNLSWINLVRGGAFATSISSRVSSGASYYGVMELSGNVAEPVVMTSSAAGRGYTGKHGDGTLTDEGNANVNNWPGVNGATGLNVVPGVYISGPGVTSDGGAGYRGGNYLDSSTGDLQVSKRGSYLGQGASTSLLLKNTMGIRGGRDGN